MRFGNVRVARWRRPFFPTGPPPLSSRALSPYLPPRLKRIRASRHVAVTWCPGPGRRVRTPGSCRIGEGCRSRSCDAFCMSSTRRARPTQRESGVYPARRGAARFRSPSARTAPPWPVFLVCCARVRARCAATSGAAHRERAIKRAHRTARCSYCSFCWGVKKPCRYNNLRRRGQRDCTIRSKGLHHQVKGFAPYVNTCSRMQVPSREQESRYVPGRLTSVVSS